MSQIQPFGNGVLVEAFDEAIEQFNGGIIVPDTARKKSNKFKVIALGTGKLDKNGKMIPFEVKVGDTIFVTGEAEITLKLSGKGYKIINYDEILAIIND